MSKTWGEDLNQLLLGSQSHRIPAPVGHHPFSFTYASAPPIIINNNYYYSSDTSTDSSCLLNNTYSPSFCCFPVSLSLFIFFTLSPASLELSLCFSNYGIVLFMICFLGYPLWSEALSSAHSLDFVMAA